MGKLSRLLKYSAFLSGGLHIVNRWIDLTSSPYVSRETSGNTYLYQNEKVIYKKIGNGADPVLLLHRVDPLMSSNIWDEFLKIADKEKYTFYVPDLPGCGKSFKRQELMTNYFYMQFLSSFIQDIIKAKPVVIGDGNIGSVCMALAANNPVLIKRLTVVDPSSVSYRISDDKYIQYKLLEKLIRIPVIGTSLYQLIYRKTEIQRIIEEEYVYDVFHVKHGLNQRLYENAHRKANYQKYIYLTSIQGLLEINLRKFVEKISIPTYLLVGEVVHDKEDIIQEYKTINNAIQGFEIPECKYLPQIENPEAMISILEEME